MAVAYKCAWCGKEYVEPLNYEGSLKGVIDYMDTRTKEITAQCCGVERPNGRRESSDNANQPK